MIRLFSLNASTQAVISPAMEAARFPVENSMDGNVIAPSTGGCKTVCGICDNSSPSLNGEILLAAHGFSRYRDTH